MKQLIILVLIFFLCPNASLGFNLIPEANTGLENNWCLSVEGPGTELYRGTISESQIRKSLRWLVNEVEIITMVYDGKQRVSTTEKQEMMKKLSKFWIHDRALEGYQIKE